MTLQAFPGGDPYLDPKTGKPPPGYSDQCAIRLSVDLQKSGVSMTSYHGKDRLVVNGAGVAARADFLAAWLLKTPIGGVGTAQTVTGKDWASKVKGKSGIIEFSGYWPRKGETAQNASGGHIDLWNGARLTVSGFVDGIATWGRRVGIDQMVIPDWMPGASAGYHNLANSKRILFWPVS